MDLQLCNKGIPRNVQKCFETGSLTLPAIRALRDSFDQLICRINRIRNVLNKFRITGSVVNQSLFTYARPGRSSHRHLQWLCLPKPQHGVFRVNSIDTRIET